ncbi:MAG: NADP-dependent oxidoreductase [Ktedonobacteraceae bacterium]|nr:NADP-dependent oxidoreductase [Ktedonobacteraceae bacterium]
MMSTMRAIHVHSYGDADQLKLEEIPQPEPQEGEVLVRVHAAGVNPIDWKIRSGWMKSVMPVTLPYVPGNEFAGVIERVDPHVPTLRPGQTVFGQSSGGAYAEYCAAPSRALAPMPVSLSFDEAAAAPIGATTAWQGLFDAGQLHAGQRVLILGGSGGVGTFAVQFAHRAGAQVIATTSTHNVAFVRSLGADVVIDYTRTHIEDEIHNVDLVFDTVGERQPPAHTPH